MAERHAYTDEQLSRIAERWGFYAARATLAYALRVFGVGVVLGAFIAIQMNEPDARWYQPVGVAFVFGGSLTVLWLPLALVAFLIARRMSRFDLRVHSALERRRSARRSTLGAIGFLGLGFVVLIPGLGHALGTDAIVRSAWMAIIGVVAIAILLRTILSPDTESVDWSRSQLCRRCGYDRGEGVHVCPECGEGATNA